MIHYDADQERGHVRLNQHNLTQVLEGIDFVNQRVYRHNLQELNKNVWGELVDTWDHLAKKASCIENMTF